MNRTSLEAYKEKLLALEGRIQVERDVVQERIDFAEIEAAAAATLGPRRQKVLDAIGGFGTSVTGADQEKLDGFDRQLGALSAYQLWIDEQIAALPE